MRSTILTIFPHPSERRAGMRPALTAASSPPRTDALGPAALAAANTLPSIESVILQKLLAEIETRQLARAQPTYVIEQAPVAKHITLVRTLWALLWTLSMIVCVFVVKSIDSQTMVPKGDERQTRSIETLTASIGEQKKEFSTMIDSLQGLAGAIASSSRRTEAIPDILNRLGSDLHQIRSPIIREPVDAAPEPAAPTMIVVPQEGDSAPIPMGGHRHPPMEATVAPPEVVVHHNSVGVMDYWLVPRIISGMRTMTKVVPISQSSAGIFVHHVEEVKDYLVTPSGDWIAASEPNGNK